MLCYWNSYEAGGIQQKEKQKPNLQGFFHHSRRMKKNERRKRSPTPYYQRPSQYISTWHCAPECFGDILWQISQHYLNLVCQKQFENFKFASWLCGFRLSSEKKSNAEFLQTFLCLQKIVFNKITLKSHSFAILIKSIFFQNLKKKKNQLHTQIQIKNAP